MRTTRSDMDNSLLELTKALGKHIAKDYKDVGGWRIEYNAIYGGGRIEEIINEHGGVHDVTGRMSPSEFCGHCAFTLQMLHLMDS